MTFTTMVETPPWRRLRSMPLLWWWLYSSSRAVVVVDAFAPPRHTPVQRVHDSTVCHMMNQHHPNNNIYSNANQNQNNIDIDGNDHDTAIDTTTDSRSSSRATWSVTDDWNQLSTSDRINYDYGVAATDDDRPLEPPTTVLNSIDQVTLAALRMQNFGMSASPTTVLSKEDEWIQNSIQQIMVVGTDSGANHHHHHNDDPDDRSSLLDTATTTAAAALDTEQFLEDMGDQIARLVRCQEESPANNNNNDDASQSSLLLDECELFDDAAPGTISTTTDRQGKSSFQRVELLSSSSSSNSSSSKNEVPIWMKDGEFVFIDEQSCIGCMQCASAAPGSFQMLEQGRARTFCQRNSPDVVSAVASCPVDCMHYVSFDELKELEIARDVGVADDHRHFGHSSTRGYIPPTPLHISRRDSDANHKSSFYHFIQDKCSKSTNCPQRGCYDCPKFAPGKNPYFQEKLSQTTHVRAEHFKENGIADAYRKTADL